MEEMNLFILDEKKITLNFLINLLKISLLIRVTKLNNYNKKLIKINISNKLYILLRKY